MLQNSGSSFSFEDRSKRRMKGMRLEEEQMIGQIMDIKNMGILG